MALIWPSVFQTVLHWNWIQFRPCHIESFSVATCVLDACKARHQSHSTRSDTFRLLYSSWKRMVKDRRISVGKIVLELDGVMWLLITDRWCIIGHYYSVTCPVVGRIYVGYDDVNDDSAKPNPEVGNNKRTFWLYYYCIFLATNNAYT